VLTAKVRTLNTAMEFKVILVSYTKSAVYNAAPNGKFIRDAVDECWPSAYELLHHVMASEIGKIMSELLSGRVEMDVLTGYRGEEDGRYLGWD
jgi:hypothetical protein